MARKTFNEKLNDSKDMPKIVLCNDAKTLERYGGNKMLIASPLEYDAIMRQIPEGFVITTDKIREYLTNRHQADFTCQLTSGIFISLAAHASDERDSDKTPYWRTLKINGELNEKYPGGIERQKENLEHEGHIIIQKGKRYFVKDYVCSLFQLMDMEAVTIRNG